MFKPYKSYNFKDKDPIIDTVRTIVQDSGSSYQEISNASGVSTGCINAWFNGATRRPHHASVMAVVRVLGYDLVLQRRGGAKVIPLKRKRA